MVSLRKCGFYVRSIECALSLGLGKLAKANSKMACRGILSPEHVTCSVSPLMKKFWQTLSRAVPVWQESANQLKPIAHAGKNIVHMHTWNLSPTPSLWQNPCMRGVREEDTYAQKLYKLVFSSCFLLLIAWMSTPIMSNIKDTNLHHSTCQQGGVVTREQRKKKQKNWWGEITHEIAGQVTVSLIHRWWTSLCPFPSPWQTSSNPARHFFFFFFFFIDNFFFFFFFFFFIF